MLSAKPSPSVRGFGSRMAKMNSNEKASWWFMTESKRHPFFFQLGLACVNIA
jgi:hypothetical protein